MTCYRTYYIALFVAFTGLWAGCNDLATPAELVRPQVLAIRADPPAIPPGEASALSILVADQDGAVPSPEVTWEATAGNPGEPPLGSVAVGDGGEVIYTAPDAISEELAIATVTARVASDAGELVAVKAIGIGDLPLSNPELMAFTADGADLLADQTLTLEVGQTVSLAVDIGQASGDMTTFAWYATAGTIDLYQSNPVDMVARDEPGSGWLFVVVRDGLGGVVWQAIEVTVQ